MLENPVPDRARPRLRLRPATALAALVLALLAGPLALPAQAAGSASTVVADGNLAKDGTLRVTQTVTFSGPVPAQLSERFETRQNLLGSREQEVRLSAFSATAKGAAVTPAVTTDGRYTTVTVPTGGADRVTLGYTAVGAVVSIDGGTALRWRLLQGLSASVTSFSATVQIPGSFSYVACTAGSPNSSLPCGSAGGGTEGSPVPTFTDGPRGEGEMVAVDIGFPAGAVAANEIVHHQWTVGRAFSARPLPLLLSLALLVLGGLGLLALHRRAGRDAVGAGRVSRAAEFVPVGPGETEFRVVGDVRPGHVGTVSDERVDPIDVTASLLDLAVRGHLLITELPRGTAYARADWTLTRLPDPGAAALRPFEQQLLDAVAPVGAAVLVSELPERIGQSIPAVQDALYDEVVSHGWYERRPDATRHGWSRIAVAGLVVAVVATVLLAAFTTFGLIGLACVLLALGLVFVAQEMPARTAEGSALLAGLGALRSDLTNQRTDQMPAGRELRELSEVLPYAVVLGGADRWLDAFAAADTDQVADSTDLTWYHGPDDWQLRDLPDSLRNFITTVSGRLFAR